MLIARAAPEECASCAAMRELDCQTATNASQDVLGQPAPYVTPNALHVMPMGASLVLILLSPNQLAIV